MRDRSPSRPEGGHPTGGELEGQRQAVELTAHLDDGLPRGVVDAEPRRDPLRPRREQLDRRPRPGCGRVGGRDREGAEPEQLLLGQVERLPARGQHRQPGAPGQQVVHQLPDLGQHVLAVVEDEERLAGAQPGDAGLVHLVAGRGAQAEARGQRGHQRRRVVELGQRGEPGGARVQPGQLGGEPGLADTARPDERHQPLDGEELLELAPARPTDRGSGALAPGGRRPDTGSAGERWRGPPGHRVLAGGDRLLELGEGR